jgi:hypothetical protein
MTDAIKLCKNCVHCRREKAYDSKILGGVVSTATDLSWKHARCFRVTRLTVDLITGKQDISRRGELCSLERRDLPIETCGSDAKFYESRKDWK